MKKKYGQASWHTPVLGIDCPHCGKWDDYYEQWVYNEYPFDICKSASKDELVDVVWICENCEKEFELDLVES